MKKLRDNQKSLIKERNIESRSQSIGMNVHSCNKTVKIEKFDKFEEIYINEKRKSQELARKIKILQEKLNNYETKEYESSYFINQENLIESQNHALSMINEELQEEKKKIAELEFENLNMKKILMDKTLDLESIPNEDSVNQFGKNIFTVDNSAEFSFKNLSFPILEN